MRPQGWLSLARSQSWRTADLLQEHGLAYCCDWVNDELPWRFANGLVNLPLSVDLSDRQIVAVQQHSAEAWAQMMRDAFDWLASEAAAQSSARVLPIQLTPYIMGQPFRIDALEIVLAELAARKEVWFAHGAAIVESWAAQS